MDTSISPQIQQIIDKKAKKGIQFLGVQMNPQPPQLVFEFSDQSQIVVSTSGIQYLPPSKGNA